ncbi:hypothetical protein [Actinophytocola sp.]|uniref:hypothetical protein n=1 Tax=Actinophytocola sp. TaxID=1872138 RepID=UPI003D6B3024
MSSSRGEQPSTVSVGWAVAVVLVLWWPLTFVAVEVQRPRPGEPGVDMTPLLYVPAAIAWIPMVAITALVAFVAGQRLGAADKDKRRDRGLVCGGLMTIIGPVVLLFLG